MVLVEFEAEGFDDEVVIFALGQAGDSDSPDDAGAGDVDGEAAAVGGVVGVGEVVAFAERAVILLEREADGVGAAVKAGDDVGFALDPPGVVWCSAKCGVEERLMRLAEAADVNDDGLVAGSGEFAKAEAETPGGIVVEGGEEELGFLTGDLGEVFGDGHCEMLPSVEEGIRWRLPCLFRVGRTRGSSRPAITFRSGLRSRREESR